jgi:hypothetical protein
MAVLGHYEPSIVLEASTRNFHVCGLSLYRGYACTLD